MNFLFNSGETDSGDVQNRYDFLKDHLDYMRSEAPAAKNHYYSNTLSALRRMRDELRKHDS